MAFIALSTTQGQVEHLVNTDTIVSVAVGPDERMNQKALIVTFQDGSTTNYRPVTAHGNLQDDVAHKSPKDLLKALRSYIADH